MLNRDNQGGMVRRPQGSSLRPYGGQGTMRWDPFREMEEMHRRMDDLFSQAFGISLPDISMPRAMNAGGSDTEPDVDIYENNNEFIIHAFLPGVNQEDIQVHATDSTITLFAETRSPFENQNQQAGSASGPQATGQPGDGQQTKTGQTNAQNQQGPNATQDQTNQQGQNAPHTQHRQSRYSRYNRFQFAYTLPEEIKLNEVKAQFRNGRLELHLPKMQRAQQAGVVRIPISGESASGAQGKLGGAAQSISGSTGPQGMNAQTSGTARTSTQESAGKPHQRGGESVDAAQNSPVQPAGQKASKTEAGKSS